VATRDAGNREIQDGTLTVRIEAGNAGCTLSLAGELDMANAATLEAELDRAADAGAAPITVDMRELEFIDSTGIAALVAAHRRLNDRGGERVRLVRSKASAVQRVMDLTGLDAELPFVSLGDD
jgi:anti-sigma B factor antagonist